MIFIINVINMIQLCSLGCREVSFPLIICPLDFVPHFPVNLEIVDNIRVFIYGLESHQRLDGSEQVQLSID